MPSSVTAEAPPVARCAPGEETTLPPFHAPTGDDTFRQGIARAGAALRCCDPAHLLEGQRLVVELTPESPETARGSLVESYDELQPAVEECLRAHLATWVMRPAPRSDVLRPRLSPFGPRYASSPASIRLALPL